MAEKPKSEKWKGAKTRNLTAKQQEKAKRIVGGGRSEKVKAEELKTARANTIDIGTTKWMKAAERKTAGQKGRGGLLTDASGKALTGTVKLPSGKTATYVRGKRIGVVAEKPKKPTSSGGSGSTSRTGTSATAKAAGAGKKYEEKKPSAKPGNRPAAAPAAPSARSMMAENRRRAQLRRGTNSLYNNGTRVSMSSGSAPKDGERRTRMVGNQRVVEKYDARNKRWLPLTGSRGGR